MIIHVHSLLQDCAAQSLVLLFERKCDPEINVWKQQLCHPAKPAENQKEILSKGVRE